MRPFVKSVLLGTLAGASPVLVYTLFIAASWLSQGEGSDLLFAVKIAISPLAMALPMVLTASIFIGLPLTAILKWRGWESARVYIFAGALVGFIWPITVFREWMVEFSIGTALLGALGGVVTAYTWWVYRRGHLAPRGEA